MEKIIWLCDICEKEVIYKEINQKKLSVIFETDQTEGRACDPYLSLKDVDICNTCYAKILEGCAVHGRGAQGYNKYYFRKA